MTFSSFWWPLIQNIFWAGIVALGYAILFNSPKRTLFGCALSGTVAYAVRVLLVQYNLLTIEAATLIAATAVSFLAVLFGRRWHAPVPVFVVPGVIPLIPGLLAFTTMIDILTLTTGAPQVDEALLAEVAVNSLRTALILCGIAGGVAVPSLLLRRHRPMT